MKFFIKPSHINNKKEISVFSSYHQNKIAKSDNLQRGKYITLGKQKLLHGDDVGTTSLNLSIINFLTKCGLKFKTKNMFFKLAQQADRFLFENKDYIYQNYKDVVFITQEIFDKDQGFLGLLSNLLVTIRPPFVMKAIAVHKKSKKKSKNKYKLRIIYRDELLRTNNAVKQLQHHTNNYSDNKFILRLYKTILFTFLEQKNSELYKNKKKIFKKYFKI